MSIGPIVRKEACLGTGGVEPPHCQLNAGTQAEASIDSFLQNLRPVGGEAVDIYLERGAAFTGSLPSLLGNGIDRLRTGIGSVVYVGEDGLGNGVIRDWFAEVSAQISHPSTGLFQMSEDIPHYLKLNTERDLNRHGREMFEAVGRFIAFALISDHQVGLKLPIMFYAKLLNLQIDLEEIKEDEPLKYNSLSALFEYDNTLLETIPMTIRGVEYELTEENRHELVTQYVNSLSSIFDDYRFDLIRNGFDAVVPITQLSRVATPSTLRRRLYGFTRVNVEELMASIDFGRRGYTRDSPQIKWLHGLLRTFTQEERRMFLRFVTGTSQVPACGFANMKEKIKIEAYNMVERLPTSRNCFNTLILPRYTTNKELVRKLRLAILDNSGMTD